MAKKCPACNADNRDDARVCEYCGTVAQDTGSDGTFRSDKAREWGRKAQDWGRQAGQQAQEWGREARDWGRDVKGRFTQQTGETGMAASEDVRTGTRSKWIAFMLCLLLGRWGIHRLYVGKIGTGLLYMATKGFGYAGVVMDLILILTGHFTDGEGRPLRK